jgi:WD40 repeat protein
LDEPYIELRGHAEKLYCIEYHPYVKSVLASASYDRTIKVWNVDAKQDVQTLKGHNDVVDYFFCVFFFSFLKIILDVIT